MPYLGENIRLGLAIIAAGLRDSDVPNAQALVEVLEKAREANTPHEFADFATDRLIDLTFDEVLQLRKVLLSIRFVTQALDGPLQSVQVAAMLRPSRSQLQ